MAIWNGQQNTGAVLKVAEQWKQNCLVDDGSRHSAEEIWTAANVSRARGLRRCSAGSEASHYEMMLPDAILTLESIEGVYPAQRSWLTQVYRVLSAGSRELQETYAAAREHLFRIGYLPARRPEKPVNCARKVATATRGNKPQPPQHASCGLFLWACAGLICNR